MRVFIPYTVLIGMEHRLADFNFRKFLMTILVLGPCEFTSKNEPQKSKMKQTWTFRKNCSIILLTLSFLED